MSDHFCSVRPDSLELLIRWHIPEKHARKLLGRVGVEVPLTDTNLAVEVWFTDLCQTWMIPFIALQRNIQLQETAPTP